MFKAFYWMFTDKEQKMQFLKNCLHIFIYTAVIIGIILFLLTNIMPNAKFYKLTSATAIISQYGLLLVALLLCIFLIFLYIGYFYKITDAVIERDNSPELPDIYNKKAIKIKELITIPEFNFLSYIWTGLSSTVAAVLVIIPIVLLLVFVRNTNPVAIITLIILANFMFLGLSWNYAKNNSVFSMLNIFVSINLIANFPIRYIWNWILLLCLSIAHSFIQNIFGTFLQGLIIQKSIQSILTAGILPMALYILFLLYILHVSAYLVGSIATPKYSIG